VAVDLEYVGMYGSATVMCVIYQPLAQNGQSTVMRLIRMLVLGGTFGG